MSKLKYKISFLILIPLLSIIAFYTLTKPLTYSEYKNKVFQTLKTKGTLKKQEILHYLEKQNKIAMNIAPVLVDIFNQMLILYQKNAFSTRLFYDLERALEEYYVFNMGQFYDVLFLNNAGDIFFSIKKELDLFKNIHDPMFKNLALSDAVKNLNNKVKFVDYEYYAVSAEPASFYIVPLFFEKQKIGSIILQLPINRINSILTNREGLGKTGEVYLINKKHLMLTQSRFFDDDSILSKKIDTEAIRNANSHVFGEKVILDYRDKMVFSVYEKVIFQNTEWIIVAEIDEDEVITNYYLELEDTLFSNIKQYIMKHQKLSSDCHFDVSNDIKVDIKEYQKSKEGNKLYTIGVATCTALSIYMPDKFGYLLHIPPTDEVYGHSLITKWWMKEEYTNMVDIVMKRIYRFDIYPYERTKLQFGIVATHEDSLKKAIHTILDYGIDLSQIRVSFQPNYSSVDVVLNYKASKTENYWKTSRVLCSTVENGFNLGKIVEKIVEL